MPEGLGVFACQLGGDDGRTLLMCAAPDFFEEPRKAAREAVLLTTTVDVPHAGLHRMLQRMTFFRYVAALLFVALAAPAAAHAGGRDVACGATITSDTKLRADLTNCPGDGLVIGADGITLDLGRRTIDGTGADGQRTGIRLAGRRGVTIKGGTVQEFGAASCSTPPTATGCTGVTVRASARARHQRAQRLRPQRLRRRRFDRQPDRDRDHRVDGQRGARQRARPTTRSPACSRSARRAHASRRNRVAGNAGNGIAIVEGSTDNQVLANSVQGCETGLIVDTVRPQPARRSTRSAAAATACSWPATPTPWPATSSTARSAAARPAPGYGIAVLSGDGNLRQGQPRAALGDRRHQRRGRGHDASRSTSRCATATSGSRRSPACATAAATARRGTETPRSASA